MKKLLILLFLLGLMASCGQKQEPAEEAPAMEESAAPAAADTMAADTTAMDAEEAPEE